MPRHDAAGPPATPTRDSNVARGIKSISNLSESRLHKLSGAPLQLGKGFEATVSRRCVAMPHPGYLASAARFVAVKEFPYDTDRSHAQRTDAALVRLSEARGQHVVSARHVDASGRAGTALAHMDLERFLEEHELDCKDALVIVRDLSLGLDSLHAVGYSHGDIATRNVLVGPAGYQWADIAGHAVSHVSRSNDAGCFGHLVERDVFAKIASRSDDAGPDAAAFIATRLARSNRDVDQATRDREQQVLAQFSKALSLLQQPGRINPVSLVHLASLADELIGAFQSKPGLTPPA